MSRPAKKAEFVRQHLHKPNAEIIAAGAKQGISLSKSYVSKLRSPHARAPAASTRTLGRTATQDTARTEFRALVMRIGTERAREWLAAIDNGPIAI